MDALAKHPEIIRKSQDFGGTELNPTVSVDQATFESVQLDENRNGEFHRSFSPRQVHIIALGSNIGSGIFIGTGKALANGGPGNMIIAYALACSAVWAVLQTLSEMTISFPTTGNYIDYADRWVDPALAFGAGFAEWLGWCAVIGAEAVFFNILIQFWADGSFPLAASLTIFLAVSCALFILPNKYFAWFEYFTSLVKIFLFLLILTVSLAIVCGAGPGGYVHDGAYWRDLPAFKNGFSGFSNALLLASWAVGDQVFIGIMGGEAENPRFSMAHATKLVPFRVNTVYLLLVMFITLLVPSNDENLLGGSGVTASPFIIAVEGAGIPGIPHIMNVCMLLAVLSFGAESIYLSARIWRTMAHKRLIPEFMAKVDSRGRPRWALIITSLTGIVLTYLNLSSGGATAFGWLISITNASTLCNWMIIAFTSWRFHQILKTQNDPLWNQPYAWRSSLWPLAPVWLFTVSTLILACLLGAGIDPVDGSGFAANNFFQYMIGILIIVGFTGAYKLIMSTPWRNKSTADLLHGRRLLTVGEINQLDTYYAMPKWRRFGTYLQVW